MMFVLYNACMWCFGMIKTFIVLMFLEFFQKLPGGIKVRLAMHELCVVFLDFVMNRLAPRVTPPGEANTVQKYYFSYFSRGRNRWALVLYRQALGSWFLGVRRHKFFWFVQFL